MESDFWDYDFIQFRVCPDNESIVVKDRFNALQKASGVSGWGASWLTAVLLAGNGEEKNNQRKRY